jgi:hypothetical protein
MPSTLQQTTFTPPNFAAAAAAAAALQYIWHCICICCTHRAILRPRPATGVPQLAFFTFTAAGTHTGSSTHSVRCDMGEGVTCLLFSSVG